MTRSRCIVGLGEILWDVFPDRRCLGGAPANVVYHAAALGDRGVVLSRVGQDELGEESLAFLRQRGVDVALVQRDPTRRTGVTRVEVAGGHVRFEIESGAAWAHPVWTEDWAQCLSEADAVCFGTLLCAGEDGRKVLERAAAAVPAQALRLLDLNLRPPFDTDQAVDCALACANVVKLSEEEALRLARRFEVQGVDGIAERLLARADMRAVAVTFGAQGSALYSASGRAQQAGVALPAGVRADPVGAGDGFTAALAHHLVRGHAPARACIAANRYGAFVAAHAGAMPDVPGDVRAEVTA